MAVLKYTIRAKDEFSDTFDRLINISETASGFIIANLGIRAAEAVSSMTSQAVADFSNVEVALRRVAAATGIFGIESDALISVLMKEIELGKDLGFTMSETAKALEMLVMAGYSVDDSLAAITPILKTATIETMSLQEAVTLTVTILGMYGLQAADAARVTEVLANAAVHGILPISKIGMGLAYVGKQAADMGSSLEETTAALVLSTNQGLRAHMAGRYLRRMLMDLTISEDKLGFSIRDTTGQMLNLTRLMEELDKHLATLGTGYEKSTYLSEMFGVQSGTLVYALTGVNEQGQSNVDMMKDLTTAMSRTGTASSMASEIMNSFWGVMRKFRSEISQIAVDLGSHLTPMMVALLGPTKEAATLLRNLLNPALDITTNIIRGLAPLFTILTGAFNALSPLVARLAVGYLSLKIGIGAVVGAYRLLELKLFQFKMAAMYAVSGINYLVAALRLLPMWFKVIPHSASLTLSKINLLSPAMAGLAAGLRGVADMTFRTGIAMKLYTAALKANQIATLLSTAYMNIFGNAIIALAAKLGIATGMATLLSAALGILGLTAIIIGVIVVVRSLADIWKATMDRMKVAMAGASTRILNDMQALSSAVSEMQDQMNALGRDINAINQTYQMNELRIEALQRAMEAGTMSIEEATMAIQLLTEANARLSPILSETRLQQSMLRDELAGLSTELDYHLGVLEKLKDARVAVTEAQLKEYQHTKLTKDEVKSLTEALDSLGISYSKITKGRLLSKRVTFDFINILEELDKVIAGHELTGDQLAEGIDNLKDSLNSLSDDLGMSESQWENFWRNIEETTSVRGRTMLSVLSQIGVAIGKLDYSFGATSREIERLNLRFRENELIIRETEKAMRTGSVSYVEGAAKIRALRKENEEIALARDEARLEQDKLNLAMDEATETIEAYQSVITSLIREHEGLLAKKYELEDKMQSGAELTDDEKVEYEKLTTAISDVQAQMEDYQNRLDTIKERFPAIEEGITNLRGALTEFASGLSEDFIGPIDAAMLDLIDGLDTVFSTQFDFLPPTIDWQPIWDTLAELTETDWEINLKLMLDRTGVGEIEDIIDEITTTGGGAGPTAADEIKDTTTSPYIIPPPWERPDKWWEDDTVAKETTTALDGIQGALELMGEAQLVEAEGYLAFSEVVGGALDGAKNALETSLETYGEASLTQADAFMEISTNIADKIAGFVDNQITNIGKGLNELGSAIGDFFTKSPERNITITMENVSMTGVDDAQALARELVLEIDRAEQRVVP